MGWFLRDRRGISWKDQTMDSISPPPLPLMVFSGLFLIFMFLAAYSDFKEKMETGMMKFRFGLILSPVVGILAVTAMLLGRRWWRYALGLRATVAADSGDWPWGLVLVLVVLIVMVYYQSSFQPALFRSI